VLGVVQLLPLETVLKPQAVGGFILLVQHQVVAARSPPLPPMEQPSALALQHHLLINLQVVNHY
jgi:hypothetical protein